MFLKNRLIYYAKKYRFFNLFIIIGFFSIIFEILILNFLLKLNINFFPASYISLFFGICFAFILNFKFNFKIHRSRIYKAFIYFVIISSISRLLQELAGQNYMMENTPYEIKRISLSGSLFIFAYFLHRNFSFQDYKRIGVALYLSKKIQLKKIFNLIGDNTNFIHIDIVDKSFSKNNLTNDLRVIKKIKKIWPNQKIEFHIMSKFPMKWVKKIINHADKIYVHFETKENINEVRNYIIQRNKDFGIALTLDTNPKKIINILKRSSGLLILGVKNPGFSGQSFNNKAFDYIDYFNRLYFRKKFRLCIDGGVNKEIARVLEVDDLVSNSYILASNNPAVEIDDMKNSGF